MSLNVPMMNPNILLTVHPPSHLETLRVHTALRDLCYECQRANSMQSHDANLHIKYQIELCVISAAH